MQDKYVLFWWPRLEEWTGVSRGRAHMVAMVYMR